MRLDLYLVENGLCDTRSRARQLIDAGTVLINQKTAQKAGYEVKEGDAVELTEAIPYVSRGGLKLEKALEVFHLAVEGACCLDAGASTGGFTDCLLQRGAAKVYAVDVGSHQLREALLAHPKVKAYENTDIRLFQPDDPELLFDLICADLSFISLTKVLEPLGRLLKEGAPMVLLVKPQFEAGKEALGKGGVVKDIRQHQKVIERVLEEALKVGLSGEELTFSPVTGQKGNREYLLLLRKTNDETHQVITALKIQQVTQEAFAAL